MIRRDSSQWGCVLGRHELGAAGRIAYAGIIPRLAQSLQRPGEHDAVALLDGAAKAHLRDTVPLRVRRRLGAFFTGASLADRVLAGYPGNVAVTDPACGAGDLLVDAARRLPVARTSRETIEAWGEVLHGSDLVPEFVQSARLRLALLAAHRTGDALRQEHLVGAFPRLRVADGLTSLAPETCRGWLVLNPPFGYQRSPAAHRWWTGKVARAAVFVERAVSALAPGSFFAAILPDVLRSGSRYASLREWLEIELDSTQIQIEGRFDDDTDVDVFILRGRKCEERRRFPIDWWPTTAGTAAVEIGADFEVHVGPIVEYRDPKRGTTRTYLNSAAMRPWSVQKRISGSWNAGPHFVRPPFVAIRRTSSPTDAHRVVASVIAGRRPIAVENHIITARPRSGRFSDARALLRFLKSEEAHLMIQSRIRCRHLTVLAIAGLTWRQRERPRAQIKSTPTRHRGDLVRKHTIEHGVRPQ